MGFWVITRSTTPRFPAKVIPLTHHYLGVSLNWGQLGNPRDTGITLRHGSPPYDKLYREILDKLLSRALWLPCALSPTEEVLSTSNNNCIQKPDIRKYSKYPAGQCSVSFVPTCPRSQKKASSYGANAYVIAE